MVSNIDAAMLLRQLEQGSRLPSCDREALSEIPSTPLSPPAPLVQSRSMPTLQPVSGKQGDTEKLVAIRKEVNEKVVLLSAFLTRLGSYASQDLERGLSTFQELSMSLSLPDCIARVDGLRQRIRAVSSEIEHEVTTCCSACADAHVSRIDHALMDNVLPPSSSLAVSAACIVKDRIITLLRTGRTATVMVIGQNNPCFFKARYRSGQIQVLAKEEIGGGGMKEIAKVSLFLGPKIGSFGDVFVYAKPRKEGSMCPPEHCLLSVQRELQWSSELRERGVKNIPNIEAVLREKSTTGELKGIVMEWFEEGDASNLISSSQYPLGHGDRLNRAILAHQIAMALDGMHNAGRLHGDVKSENVFIKRTSGGASFCLADLGCGLTIGERKFNAIGSPMYIAPEQWAEYDWIATPGIDMWGFGLFMVELFFGPSQNSIRMGLPENFLKLPADEKHRLVWSLRQELVQKLTPKKRMDKFIEDLLSENSSQRPTAADAVRFFEAMIASLRAPQ